MNRAGIAAVLAGVLLCVGLGLYWNRWKAARQARPPLREDLEDLKRIDPKLVIAREAARLSPGLAKPRGVAVGPDDRVYVAGDEALVVLGSDGAPLARHALGEAASCAAVDADSTVYLGMRDRVVVLDAKGEKKASWERLGPGTWITSIAVSADGVAVADFGHRAVLRFDKSGKPLKEIPGFNIPSPYFDVAFDATGSLWAANTARHRLENYQEGSLASAWGRESARIEGFSGCCNPSHFAVRRDGSFVTAEKGLVRIKIHDPAGRFVGVVAGPRDFPEGTVGLDVAADSKGRILVLDPSTSTVRVYVETAARGGD